MICDQRRHDCEYGGREAGEENRQAHLNQKPAHATRAERRDRIKHTNKVRRRVGPVLVGIFADKSRTVLSAKSSSLLVTLSLIIATRMSGAMLINGFNASLAIS
jgi:hypothetical protein